MPRQGNGGKHISDFEVFKCWHCNKHDFNWYSEEKPVIFPCCLRERNHGF